MKPALVVLLWEDTWKSGKVFLTGLTVYGMIFVYGYSLLSLLSIMLCIYTVITVLFNLLLRWRGRRPSESSPPHISQEFAKSLCEHVNRKIVQYFDILNLNDLLSAVTLAAMLYILYRVGLVFSDATMLLIGYLLAFSLPCLYAKYERQIQDNVSKMRSKINKVSDSICNAIPKAESLKKAKKEEPERQAEGTEKQE